MTAAGELLAAEIRHGGPIPFHRFMEVALYHPVHGYYRTGRDRFGREGDFFTAEQIQPVFGTLLATVTRRLWREMGRPSDFTVVELGPGRREMAESFSEWRYVPVEIESGALPNEFRGLVFSNEFFDALPVEVMVYTRGQLREQRVTLKQDHFVWTLGDAVAPELDDYVRRFFPLPEEGRWYEANLEALRWMERIGRALRQGWVLTIDYGLTRTEAVRFPRGTLMGYQRHTAREDVLEDPGARDITAHVNFTALAEYGATCGLKAERLETLVRTLLDAGAEDQFAAALAGGSAHEVPLRLQLKTLLFGMGEAFRVLWQRRSE